MILCKPFINGICWFSNPVKKRLLKVATFSSIIVWLYGGPGQGQRPEHIIL